MKNRATVLLVLLVALSAHAQENEIALNFLRIHMPLTQEFTWGGEVQYRYRWTPRWSGVLALGYQRASIQEAYHGGRGRLTFGESCLVWDGYISRAFFFASPMVLSFGIGISVGYSSSYEIDLRLLQNGDAEIDFRPYRILASYLLLPAEMGLPVSDQLTLILRPTFRLPTAHSHPPMSRTLSIIGPFGNISQSTTYYPLDSMIGVALGAVYRFY